MKRMSEGQLARVATDETARRAALSQLGTWEANLERLAAQRYRAECYIASLRALELPNPKVLYSTLHYIELHEYMYCTSPVTVLTVHCTRVRSRF